MSIPSAIAPRPRRPRLVLFISGNSPNTALALANLRKMFGRKQPDPFEVVDVIQQPDRALASRVFVTPTLLFENHHLNLRLVGDLSASDALSAFLEADLE